ncbi:TPA: Blp family class II bacteriocin [Staphylococcus delphini]|nr:Blp family class II bacteriocin [Staphylococcus delphini]
MKKLDKKQLKNISGGTSVAECIGRYTAGGFIGAVTGSVLGPVGTAVGAGAGAITATPSSCKNN